MKQTERGQVLKDAIKIINGERQDVYGNPEDSFELIAKYWEVYLGKRLAGPLKAEDSVMMLTLFKIARESNQHKKDNIVDAAGYLGILGDMHSEDARKDER